MFKTIRTLMAIVMVAAATSLSMAQSNPAPTNQTQPASQAPPATPLTMDQLQQLVSPIALYPDSLVAQILAASTYPTQIVEAERFIQDNPNLKDKDLGNAVDKQDWDPSVKALAAFPSVLSDMDKNLSWTSELGDANYNQPQDVMSAIQAMRAKAHDAGNLQSNSQETVTQDAGNYEIAPADPQVVYVPVYDPAIVYGYPVAMWPGFYPWWSIGDPYISFGMGFGIGPFFGFGWGWNNWGCGWGMGGGVWYGGERWYSHSHDFYDHNAFVHGNYRGYGGGGFQHGGRGFNGRNGIAGNRGFNNNHIVNRGVSGNRGFNNGVNRSNGFAGGGNRALRGFGGQSSTPRTHSGFFGGLFGHGGGTVSNYGARGFSSTRSSGGFGGGSVHSGGFGGGSVHSGGFGGGGFHSGGFGGGGGFHGGGGFGGGGGFHGGGGFGGGGGFHGGGGHR